MKKYVSLFLGLLLLAGCSSLGRGLMEGYFDAQNKKKDEVSCMILSAGFSGLQQAKQKITNVLLVHGIGTHVPGHSMAFMLDISQKMGLDTLNRDYKEIQMINSTDQPVGVLRVYRFLNEKTQRSVVFYEQTWSEITDPIKQSLSYDTTKEYAKDRSAVNAKMKFYMNSTLPDTAIYFGPEGERMKASSLQAICWMTNYTFDQLPSRARQYCTPSPKQAINSLKDENFAFITNSLGSRIAIDALQQMAEEMRAYPKKTAESKKAVELLQNKEITVFMLANQLPVLQLGRPAPKHKGKKQDYCFENGLLYDQRIFRRLNVVAISDPNDLLSYGLEPDASDKYLDNALCPEISNVSVTTTPALDVGFGEVANPLFAHTGYQKNPYVLDLIVQGLEDNYLSPSIEDKCRWIKLKN